MFPDIQNELLANFASLTMTSISKLGEGWDNEAYLVNNKIVFKILKQRAKHIQSETARHAKVEIKLLRFLYNKLPVQTPAILYATDDGACYGYEYLNGTSLSLEHLKEGSQKQSYIKIWVSTAIALERLLSLAEATTLGLEKFQYNAYRLGRVAEVMKRDLLDSELNQVAQDCLDHYITEWEDAQLIITHGDAGLGNWIFDPKSSTYGLIDWADACIATAELQIF
ncbi:MAG TPA: aminoglycoside phosphotransferase family protein, partial [Candidatus Saccharimonadales bacterium]|nr:aminoglycoside phosphotransferase family protein [Candidatus Saccharimonadales bacterium]